MLVDRGIRDTLLFEELDEKGARAVEDGGSLDGRKFGVLRDDGDAAPGRHGFKDVHEKGNRPGGKLNGLGPLGASHPQLERRARPRTA